MTAAMLTAALGALLACDDQNPDERDEPKRVSAVAEALYGAVVQGRGSDACAALTDAGRRRLVADWGIDDLSTCPEVTARRASDFGAFERSAVTEISVKRAFVSGSSALIYDGDVQLPAALHEQTQLNARPTVLLKVNGKWRIDDVG